MKYVVLTGMSGAGKSTALKFLEDIGYFCVDNLPVPLLEKFVEIADSETVRYQKTAFGIDIRSGDSLEQLDDVFTWIRSRGHELRIVFLDASDSVLLKRYKATRRNHPLAGNGSIEDGIRRERVKIAFLRNEADTIIDTSGLLTRELRAVIEDVFLENKSFQNLMITVVSFGFKYGLPADADLVFDVRFLPNPYYEDNLRAKTGNDSEVQSYVKDCPQFGEFMERLTGLLEFLIPNYITEGKNRLVIGIGCTGGRHRSVTVANEVFRRLGEKHSAVNLIHRDEQRKTG